MNKNIEIKQFMPLLETLFRMGRYQTGLLGEFSSELLKQAVNHGFVTICQDYEWLGTDELYYEIASKGILEYNLFKKMENKTP
jgi:hypothetical protein